MCFLPLALWNLNLPHVNQQTDFTIVKSTSPATILLSNLSLWRVKIFDLYPLKFCTIQLLASKYTHKKINGQVMRAKPFQEIHRKFSTDNVAWIREQNLTLVMRTECSYCLKITPHGWIHAYCWGGQIPVYTISRSSLRLCLWRETSYTISEESSGITNM